MTKQELEFSFLEACGRSDSLKIKGELENE